MNSEGFWVKKQHSNKRIKQSLEMEAERVDHRPQGRRCKLDACLAVMLFGNSMLGTVPWCRTTKEGSDKNLKVARFMEVA